MRRKGQFQKTMPICLLLEDRPCLVVGGGAVAARKIRRLLDAGVRVRVVSSELNPCIARWLKAGKIECRTGRFAAADVKGMALVIAATDDSDVNRRVIAACRRSRVLCGAADAHWREGDFITPAVLRRGKTTIAVSTGGASCRKAREIRDSVGRMLNAQRTAID
jgi:siroheme synthase-like protein